MSSLNTQMISSSYLLFAHVFIIHTGWIFETKLEKYKLEMPYFKKNSYWVIVLEYKGTERNHELVEEERQRTDTTELEEHGHHIPCELEWGTVSYSNVLVKRGETCQGQQKLLKMKDSLKCWPSIRNQEVNRQG